MNELEKFFISVGLDENLAKSISLSEGVDETQILESLKGFGKLPKSLQDLENENFAELKSQIQNATNSKIGEVRTKWERENGVKKPNETQTQENNGMNQNSEVLTEIKSLKKEIEDLKGLNATKSLEQNRTELLQKYSIPENFHKFLKVDANTNISEFEQTIKEFAETSNNFVQSKLENSNQSFIKGNNNYKPDDVPKSVRDAFN